MCTLQGAATDFSTYLAICGIFYVQNMEKELLLNRMWIYHCHRLLPQEKFIYSF